jgi:AcrR family transcriptional regulator
VLHYYFSDKIELITCCVRQYKAECVKRYDGVVATSESPDELKQGFGAVMAATLRDEAKMHRLWYDLRTQSMFDDTYRADVKELDGSLERMIWRIVSRFAELSGTSAALSSRATYALYDGIFQQALIRHLAGDPEAAAALDQDVQRTLDLVVRPA